MHTQTDDIVSLKRMSLPPLSRAEEIDVFGLIEHGTPSQAVEAKDRVARSLFPLAIRAAELFVRSHASLEIDMEDAVAAAFLGIAEAVTRFDVEKGYRISTYAMCWIRKELTLIFHRSMKRGRLTINITDAWMEADRPLREDNLLSLLAKEESLRNLDDRMSKLDFVERTCLAVAAGLEGGVRTLSDAAKDLGLKDCWEARAIARQAVIKLGGQPAGRSDYGFPSQNKRKSKSDRNTFNLHGWLLEQIKSGPVDYSEAVRLAVENSYKPKTLLEYIRKHALCVTVLDGRKVIARRPENHVSSRPQPTLIDWNKAECPRSIPCNREAV